MSISLPRVISCLDSAQILVINYYTFILRLLVKIVSSIQYFKFVYLGLPIMVQRAATHIARRAVEMDIVAGRSPISVAAAAIYMASQVCLKCLDRDIFVLSVSR